MVVCTRRLVPEPFHVTLITSPVRILELLRDLEALPLPLEQVMQPGDQRRAGGAAVAPGSSSRQVLPCLASGLLSELCQAATVAAG